MTKSCIYCSFAYSWATLSACLKHTINACSGCVSGWCVLIGLAVSHRGVTSSTQGPPSSVPPIISADRRQEKRSIGSIRKTRSQQPRHKRAPGATMILLTLLWSLLTASQASGEVVQPAEAVQPRLWSVVELRRRASLWAGTCCHLSSVLSQMLNETFFFHSLYGSLVIFFVCRQFKFTLRRHIKSA